MKNYLFVFTLVALSIAAQDAEKPKPDYSKSQFEVATVKVAAEGSPVNFNGCEGHQYHVANVPLKLLVAVAYKMSDNRVDGLGAAFNGTGHYVASQGYTIDATAGDRSTSKDECRAMLQHLLQDRFQLQVHKETRTLHGFDLTLLDKHDALKEVTGETGMVYIMQNGIRGKAMTMEMLAFMISRPLDKPVQDATGLQKKKYDIDLKFAPQNGSESDLPALPTALQEQYGLKLKPAEVPTEFLVVDHVGKLTADN